MANSLRRLLSLTAIAPLSAGLSLLAGGTAQGQNYLIAWNQFDVCVTELTKNGIEGQAAGTACSEALIPKELSACVAKIKGETGTAIEPEKVLQACFQVRRPIDLANCVVDIKRSVALTSSAVATATEGEEASSETVTATSPLLKTLDSCRASLLPGRHSECVIALSRDVQGISAMQAMDKCLEAEDFPRDLFPAYTE